MEQITPQPNQSQPSSNTEASETERWASLIGGGAMVLMGLQQRSLRGVLMTLTGGGLLYQGITNQSTVQQAQDMAQKAQHGSLLNQTIRVEKSVTINKSAEELYSFWRNFENLPRFMKHIKSVTSYNDTRSHWIASAPLGTNVEWDADLVKDEPNKLIAWASAEGADIENSGFVRFQPATGNRGTVVKVVMEYNIPGGAVTAAIAKLFGEEPEQQIGDELRRFKMLMEAGEIATTEGQPTCHGRH